MELQDIILKLNNHVFDNNEHYYNYNIYTSSCKFSNGSVFTRNRINTDTNNTMDTWKANWLSERQQRKRPSQKQVNCLFRFNNYLLLLDFLKNKTVEDEVIVNNATKENVTVDGNQSNFTTADTTNSTTITTSTITDNTTELNANDDFIQTLPKKRRKLLQNPSYSNGKIINEIIKVKLTDKYEIAKDTTNENITTKVAVANEMVETTAAAAIYNLNDSSTFNPPTTIVSNEETFTSSMELENQQQNDSSVENVTNIVDLMHFEDDDIEMNDLTLITETNENEKDEEIEDENSEINTGAYRFLMQRLFSNADDANILIENQSDDGNGSGNSIISSSSSNINIIETLNSEDIL